MKPKNKSGATSSPQSIDFVTSMGAMLKKEAIDPDGNPVIIDGRPASMFEALCETVLRQSFQDPKMAKWILEQSGIFNTEDRTASPEERERMETGNRKKFEKRAQYMARKLKTTLEGADLWTVEVGQHVQNVAELWAVHRKVRDEYAALSSVLVIEKSREGADRSHVNPLQEAVIRSLSTLQVACNQLLKAVKTNKKPPETVDAFSQIMAGLGMEDEDIDD